MKWKQEYKRIKESEKCCTKTISISLKNKQQKNKVKSSISIGLIVKIVPDVKN